MGVLVVLVCHIKVSNAGVVSNIWLSRATIIYHMHKLKVTCNI